MVVMVVLFFMSMFMVAFHFLLRKWFLALCWRGCNGRFRRRSWSSFFFLIFFYWLSGFHSCFIFFRLFRLLLLFWLLSWFLFLFFFWLLLFLFIILFIFFFDFFLFFFLTFFFHFLFLLFLFRCSCSLLSALSFLCGGSLFLRLWFLYYYFFFFWLGILLLLFLQFRSWNSVILIETVLNLFLN